jgi:hypothetical protein
MRTLLALTLFAAAGCTSSAPAGGPDYDSVRDRLEDGSTRLFVGASGSTGTITARRWTSSGWVEGNTVVTIESGEVAAKVDANGVLTLDTLVVDFAPIAIPEDVFKKPAALDDVKISLTKPASAPAVWTSEDDATATLTLDLDFDWLIAINGGKTPLGTQHLPPVTIDVVISGAGDHVDASVALAASGELWNWAGLIEMTKLELSLSAATVD